MYVFITRFRYDTYNKAVLLVSDQMYVFDTMLIVQFSSVIVSHCNIPLCTLDRRWTGEETKCRQKNMDWWRRTKEERKWENNKNNNNIQHVQTIEARVSVSFSLSLSGPQVIFSNCKQTICNKIGFKTISWNIISWMKQSQLGENEEKIARLPVFSVLCNHGRVCYVLSVFIFRPTVQNWKCLLYV